MADSGNPLKRLIHEVHRRSLWQVLGIYAVGGWIAFEVVQGLTEGLGLPSWFPALAVVLLIIGLPVVLATAFVQEGGPGHHAEVALGSRSTGEEGSPAAHESPAAAGSSVPRRLFTWRFAFLGGVAAFALLGFVGTAWTLFGGGPRGSAGGPSDVEAPASIDRSVAVLPFVNMSGDPDNEYFSDGITEEILNALVQLPNLRVPGRTSSFAFKDQNLTIRQIADTLSVANVLEGSVRREGDRVLITAQLVDARSDTHLWSDTFERNLDDVFSIQREIATAIAEQLRLTLTGGVDASFASGATEIPEAHDAYLRGRYLWARRTTEAVQASIAQFERAVALDSLYADAWSGLADAYAVYAYNYGTPEDAGLLDEARRAAERAVQVAPESGIAHASLALALSTRGAWDESEQEFDRAIALNPGYATAHQWVGLLYMSTGRLDEALDAARRAVALDPVSVAAKGNVSQYLIALRRFSEAVQEARELVALDPGRPGSWGS